MGAARIRWWQTEIGDDEIAYVAAAIRQRHINQGEECRALESALSGYLDIPHVILTSSGSVALLLALKACGVGPGTEVILPALTFIAPAHAVLWLGARVRLVDVDPVRGLIDPAAVMQAISPCTRAIVAVHLNGRAAPVAALQRAVGGRPIAVIEDCAQALGSMHAGQPLGSGGVAAAFSMSLTKLITTGGEGGFVATSDDRLAQHLRRLRNQGVQAIASNVFPELGFNFRLTDIQAAFGRAQFAKVASRIAALRRVQARYGALARELSCIELLGVDEAAGELPLWAEVLCAERATVIEALARRGIEAKPFHPCLAMSPHLEASGRFPNAERFAARGLVLPSGPALVDEDFDAVAGVLRALGDELAAGGSGSPS